MAVTLDGVTFQDSDWLNRGHLTTVTVNGTTYQRWEGMWVAGIAEISTKVGQVGGLGVAMAYAAETGSTADAAPGDGKLTWNNATQASATTIYLDAQDANGVDLLTLIDTLDDSTSTIKGALRLTKVSDNSAWILYNLTAVTSASGYRKLTVSATSQSATSPFADGDALSLTFSRSGDKGDAGNDGGITGGALTGNIDADGTYKLIDLPAPTDGGDAARKSYVDTADALLVAQGKHTIAIPAGTMQARITNGASDGSVELATNDILMTTWNFDAATSEAVQFVIPMPKSWNEGTLTAEFLWQHPSTTTNFGVVWGIRAVAVSNDDALDAAFGTAVTVADTGGTTEDLYITAETSAMTVAGTPAEGDLVIFEVYRVVADGSDTLAVDAKLLGIRLNYTINAATDA